MRYVALTRASTIMPIVPAWLFAAASRLADIPNLRLGVVAVPRALLRAPLPPLPPTGIPMDVERWQSSAPACDFAGSIRQAVETLSWGEGYPTVAQTASFVGLSVRTLQRRLAAAGVSHQVLVAQTRFATAAVVLEKTKAKVLDLALDLGYSDHANFTRAFRRWAGCSPQAYRRGHADAGCSGSPTVRSGCDPSSAQVSPR